jgi:hypothetical protein
MEEKNREEKVRLLKDRGYALAADGATWVKDAGYGRVWRVLDRDVRQRDVAWLTGRLAELAGQPLP